MKVERATLFFTSPRQVRDAARPDGARAVDQRMARNYLTLIKQIGKSLAGRAKPGGSVPREDDPRYQRSLAALHGAVISLVERRPVATITITDLVREASVSRPTFYQHFKDVPDAVRQVALARFAQSFPLVHVPLGEASGGEGGRERIFRRTLPILQHLEEGGIYYRRVVEEAANVAFIDELINFVASQFLPEAFEDASERAAVGRKDVMVFIASGISWIVVEWVRRGFDEDVESITRRIAKLTAALVQPPA